MSGGRLLLRTVVGALLVAVVCALVSSGSPGHAAPADARHNRISGVAFLTENINIAGSSSEFQHIKADGANTVSFDVWWQVPSRTANSVNPLPNLTESDADLIRATQEARQAGLRVILTPKLLIGTGNYSQAWRGFYNPRDPAAFFFAYTGMVDHYADLAQRTGVWMYLVGSEMVRADGYTGYWRALIASAREHFNGLISYEEDWREVSLFNFGDALDVVSVSGYFPTSDEERPTLAQLEAGWHSYTNPGEAQPHDWFSAVAEQAERWGKPILFGEAGYMATTYPAQNPCCNDAHPPDSNLQYLAYKALLDTFAPQPWWAGVTWWAWNNGPLRSPEGKPAEGLLAAQSLAYPGPPAAPATPAGRSPAPSRSASQHPPLAQARNPELNQTGSLGDYGGSLTSAHAPVVGAGLLIFLVALLCLVRTASRLRRQGDDPAAGVYTSHERPLGYPDPAGLAQDKAATPNHPVRRPQSPLVPR